MLLLKVASLKINREEEEFETELRSTNKQLAITREKMLTIRSADRGRWSIEAIGEDSLRSVGRGAAGRGDVRRVAVRRRVASVVYLYQWRERGSNVLLCCCYFLSIARRSKIISG